MTLNKGRPTHLAFDKGSPKTMFQSRIPGKFVSLLSPYYPPYTLPPWMFRIQPHLQGRLRTENCMTEMTQIEGHKKQTPFLKKTL